MWRGEGGLSSVAAIYGSLFQQKVQREQSKTKPAFYALLFQYLNPQQVISNIAVPSWSLLPDSEMLSYVCFIRAPWEEHFK